MGFDLGELARLGMPEFLDTRQYCFCQSLFGLRN